MHVASKVHTQSLSPGRSCLTELRVSCIPSVGAAVLPKSVFSSLSWAAFAWSTVALAQNGFQLTHLVSPAGALPAQLEQPGWTSALRSHWGHQGKALGTVLGVVWSPGLRLYLVDCDFFSCAACRAMSSLALCSPSPPSESPVPRTASFLSPFSVCGREHWFEFSQDLNLPWTA